MPFVDQVPYSYLLRTVFHKVLNWDSGGVDDENILFCGGFLNHSDFALWQISSRACCQFVFRFVHLPRMELMDEGKAYKESGCSLE